MPLNESNVVARARRLLVCTIDAANFSDKMDIIFVAEMIEKIGKFVEKFKDVSGCTVLVFFTAQHQTKNRSEGLFTSVPSQQNVFTLFKDK